ncbi:hypothetical protein D3C71_1608640 [compost metagenome]
MVFFTVSIVSLPSESTDLITRISFLISCFVSVITPTAIYGAITRETIDISLMRIFIDGPEVSLNGSPTVSPVTEALCGSDFL